MSKMDDIVSHLSKATQGVKEAEKELSSSLQAWNEALRQLGLSTGQRNSPRDNIAQGKPPRPDDSPVVSYSTKSLPSLADNVIAKKGIYDTKMKAYQDAKDAHAVALKDAGVSL